MELLMMVPLFPYPADNGSGIRIFHSIKTLSKQFNITLVAASEHKIAKEDLEYMEKFCKKVYVFNNISTKRESIIKFFLCNKPYQMIRYPHAPIKEQIQRNFLNNGVLDYNVIYFHFIQTIPFIDMSWVPERACLVLDEHNADEIYWNSYASSSNIFYRIFGKLNVDRVRAFKNQILSRVDFLVSVSEQDKKYNENNYKVKQKFIFAPNGTDMSYFSNSGTDDKKKIILFVGSMSVTMNIEAVLTFYEKCYAKVKANVDDVKFYIVGREPDERIKNLEKLDKTIKVLGGVPDVREYYKIATLAIAPFEYGGGTKLKVLEAMAMSIPMVTTTIGCQGIDVENGKHVYIEDDMNEFSEKVISILNSKIDTKKMTEEARKFVRERYDWENIYNKVVQSIMNH